MAWLAWKMSKLGIILVAYLLDLVLGDPYSFPHPVKLMGRIIRAEEKLARRIARSKKDLRILGFIIVLVNIGLGFLLPYLLLRALAPYSLTQDIVSIYLIYTCLAAKSLDFEATMVKKALGQGLKEARIRVGYIVGRETERLNQEEIIKATIETVAENTADGIIVPLFYIFLLGPPGGLMYKFINTMDSTLGYTNEKYIDIGRYPALTDDLFNYLPARLTAGFMLLSSLGKYNVKRGFSILQRDRRNHKSPNSGYPESTVAGLLGIELGGDNYYQGVLVEKPSIGDKTRDVEVEDIDRTINIMYRTEALFLLSYIIFIIVFTY